MPTALPPQADREDKRWRVLASGNDSRPRIAVRDHFVEWEGGIDLSKQAHGGRSPNFVPGGQVTLEAMAVPETPVQASGVDVGPTPAQSSAEILGGIARGIREMQQLEL